MLFRQKIYLGLNGTEKNLDDIFIPESDLAIASGYAGSCHVLEMGKHYTDYASHTPLFSTFKKLSGFPKATCFGQLEGKARASGITGNIGEVVSGIIANRTLGFNTTGIAHLKLVEKKRTPDFLLERSNKFSDLLVEKAFISSSQVSQLPQWWLMESKAITKGSITSNLKDAFCQLVLFWYRMRKEYSAGVGYGITIGTTLNPPIIEIHVFFPKNQSRFLWFLDHIDIETKYKIDPLFAEHMMRLLNYNG